MYLVLEQILDSGTYWICRDQNYAITFAYHRLEKHNQKVSDLDQKLLLTMLPVPISCDDSGLTRGSLELIGPVDAQEPLTDSYAIALWHRIPDADKPLLERYLQGQVLFSAKKGWSLYRGMDTALPALKAQVHNIQFQIERAWLRNPFLEAPQLEWYNTMACGLYIGDGKNNRMHVPVGRWNLYPAYPAEKGDKA